MQLKESGLRQESKTVAHLACSRVSRESCQHLFQAEHLLCSLLFLIFSNSVLWQILDIIFFTSMYISEYILKINLFSFLCMDVLPSSVSVHVVSAC